MADKPILEKTFNEDLDVQQKLDEGGVHSRLFLEVQGNDREVAKEALEKTVLEKMAKEKSLYLLTVKMYDLVKEEGQEYYSGIIDVESVCRDFRSFLNLILRYGPSAVEILYPEEVTLKTDEMHSIVADLSDFVQAYFTNLFSMLKDEERVALYKKMLNPEVKEE